MAMVTGAPIQSGATANMARMKSTAAIGADTGVTQTAAAGPVETSTLSPQAKLQGSYDQADAAWSGMTASANMLNEGETTARAAHVDGAVRSLVGTDEFKALPPDLQKEQIWMTQAGASSAWGAEQLNPVMERTGLTPEILGNADKYNEWAGAQKPDDLRQIGAFGGLKVHGHNYVMHRGEYLANGGKPNPEGW